MMTTDDKFQRFLEMTDHPERFTDEELMQLARDPAMKAWYTTLTEVHDALYDLPQMPDSRLGRQQAFLPQVLPLRKVRTALIGLLATAAVLTLAYLVWPRTEEMQPAVAVATTEHVPETSAPSALSATTSSHDSIQPAAASPQKAQPAAAPHQRSAVATQRSRPLLAQAAAVTPPVQEPSQQQLNTDAAATEPAVSNAASELPEAEAPQLSPEKQALADIFLAEAALQVAYKQHETVKAVRTYQASITGEEQPQPIIAF